MELGVGEYVRTHLGNIGKVIGFDTDIEGYVTDNYKVFDEVTVFKHSKNIIDLIEVRRLCEWRKNY